MSNQPSFLFRLFRAFLPPIIFKPVVDFFGANKEELFDGEQNASLFKKYIKSCIVYGEYGCGLSTQYVLENTDCSVISVDSSKVWAEKVRSKNNNSSRLDINYVDVGEIGEWGRPINYKRRENFKEYADKLWQKNIKPDLILIDGRFRVACFLTCLTQATEGTHIIFDDYTNRPEYHLVEEFLPVRETCGRQALFITSKLSLDNYVEVNKLLEKFHYVMD